MAGSPLDAHRMTGSGRAGLCALLENPADALVGLDYDGTLAPLVLDPAAAWPDPGALQAVIGAAEVFGRVAVVSGRPVASLLELLAPDQAQPTELLLVGVHGRQSWTWGGGARAELSQLLPELRLGVRVEDKADSLALHFRGCADPAQACAAAGSRIALLAARFGLTVTPGRLVLELLGPGPDKGSVLRELASGARAVCFVGDDLADLAAFAAVDELRAAGVAGLKIAVRNTESPAVARAADLVLADPAEVVAFLTELTRSACRGC